MDNISVIVRNMTVKLFKSKGIPLHPHLPLLEEKKCKNVKTVGEKIMTLFALTGLANDADQDILREWMEEENLWCNLSEQEQSLFYLDNITQSIINECSWKQESLYTLAWCCGLSNKLNYPDRECILRSVYSKLPPEIDTSSFFANLNMRNKTDIIEKLDFYYCLHTSLIHPEIWKNSEKIKTIQLEVVLERRHALEWICNFEIDWLGITLDT